MAYTYTDSVPNLDAMPAEDLKQFWFMHQKGGNARRVGLRGKGSRVATADLANYASNKATAIECRLRGDIQYATMYEDICERIYQNLPAVARW